MANQSSDDNNLLNFIATAVETMRGQMATKTELASVRAQVEFVGGQVEILRDRMATKDDVARLETRMNRFEDRMLVEPTAIRGDLEQVHLRLDGIDRALSTRLS